MSNCKFCGKPVKCEEVWHAACAETKLHEVFSDFCDHYCRYPREIHDENVLRSICDECRPINKLIKLFLVR